ncbi:MAG: sugar ABC transporter substrate-binding protein [Pseudonocardia sp.]|nr:sugar ABC transporter substrate-binding protein [Pseudonocardia sp.]
MRRYLRAAALVLTCLLALTACSAAPAAAPAPTTVTVRLWDDQVAVAYAESFAEFSRRNPDVVVSLDVVPYADYFATLPDALAEGTADDVFWLNSSYFGELADRGTLMNIDAVLPGRSAGWVPAAVEQYTRGGVLWGVPALTDGRIVVYYNKALVDAAGIDPLTLAWDPTDPAKDTLLPAARRLTADTSGRTADTPGFDPGSVAHYGFNAGRDLQAVYYNFVGSNGGHFQNPDGTFAFAGPRSVEAFQYLADMINEAHVAPPAADTNDNPDFARDQFVAGRLALFQSGTYNLKNVADGARFDWGVAPLVAGPAGRVSVVNSVIAAGNARTAHPEAVAKVLAWLGSADGAAPIGTSGAALPAVTAAQQGFFDHWRGRGVDTRYFGEAGGTATIEAPNGPRFGAGARVFQPVLSDVFAGRTAAGPGLRAAQDAANAAIR